MQEHLRAGPATGEVCPTLADDLLRGADAIAIFVFGDAKTRRREDAPEDLLLCRRGQGADAHLSHVECDLRAEIEAP